MPEIVFLPDHVSVKVSAGTSIQEAGRSAGLLLDAPCGGHGLCGKCKVRVGKQEVLACQYQVEEDVTVILPEAPKSTGILVNGMESGFAVFPVKEGDCHISVDIGTTTVVAYLLDGKSGRILGSESMLNPQYPYGADVISRIQAAENGELDVQCQKIRRGIEDLVHTLCGKYKKASEKIGTMAIVGNPAMQQIFLKIDPENLTHPPFAPAIKNPVREKLSDYFMDMTGGVLLTIPDIAGFIGADTMGCVLSTGMYKEDKITLMIDIGTNGEMVLGNKDRMVARSTAAGPALEGGRISCGMRGGPGAVDHIWMEDDTVCSSVIGWRETLKKGSSVPDVEVQGLCGSGLIDAIAVMLDLGILNRRGRIQKAYYGDEKNRIYAVTDQISLTQEDIREVQMAKGAIAAGIELMMEELEITYEQVDRVILCGAFGTYMNAKSAARIGLIPEPLLSKVIAGGNAAGMGCRQITMDQKLFALTGELVQKIEPLDLASRPQFQRTFAKQMAFSEV